MRLGLKAAFFLCLANLFAAACLTEASATTYDYIGQPFNPSPGCFGLSCVYPGGLNNGSVTFNFDTSGFTGTLTLSTGDTASLGGIVPNPVGSGSIFGTVYFPSSAPPPGTEGYADVFSGTFVLANGSITSWSIGGGLILVGCGLGPGCTSGVSVSSSPTYDSFSGEADGIGASGSNGGGGAWEDVSPAVPEPSTWAMLLIGFAGIGFAAYRRKLSNGST
jgi:hypothetical protein